MKQSTNKPTVTTAKRGTLHKCMKCQRQLTTPGERFCQTKQRDCRPCKTNLSRRESDQLGGGMKEQ